MEILDDVISSEDLQKFECKYNEKMKKNTITNEDKFEYACCLVRSKYPADIRKGILLFEELCKERTKYKRDYMYFLAIGHARVKEHVEALGYCRKFLEVEPLNNQVRELEKIIQKRMDKEGAFGMAITAGAVMAVGVIVAAGIAISKK